MKLLKKLIDDVEKVYSVSQEENSITCTRLSTIFIRSYEVIEKENLNDSIFLVIQVDLCYSVAIRSTSLKFAMRKKNEKAVHMLLKEIYSTKKKKRVNPAISLIHKIGTGT